MTRSKLFWILLFVLVRILFAAGLFLALGGSEFSDDTVYHLYFINNPLCLLVADSNAPAAYSPPLLPLLMSVVPLPLLSIGFPEFLSLRFGSIFWETLAFGLYCFYCQNDLSDKQALIRRLLWVLCPAALLTSAVMAQDETTSMFFAVMVAIMLISNRKVSAGIMIGLGVAASKVFFLVIAGASMLGFGCRNIKAVVQRALPIFVTIFCIYAAVGLVRYLQGVPMNSPSLTFTNSTSITSVINAHYDISVDLLRRISQTLCLVLGLLPPALLWLLNRKPDGRGVIVLSLAMLSWVFAFFYHLQPEYMILMLPLILIVDNLYGCVLWGWVTLAFPWGTNILYSIRHYGSVEGNVKSGIANTITGYIPFSIDLLFQIAVVVNTLLMIAMAIYYTCRVVAVTKPAPAAN